MFIYFIGDPHGQFDTILTSLTAHTPDAIVVLGDMDLPQPLEAVFATILPHTRVYWIHGNHEADSDPWYDNAYASALAANNLHGRVVEIDGVRIAGFGGVFREKIWHPDTGRRHEKRNWFLRTTGKGNRWRDGLPRKHRVSIWPEDFEAMKRVRADVLVTHEAPSCHRYGFAAIDELADAIGARTIFHGHHHEDYSDTLANGRIAVHGVGLRGIRDLDGQTILPGEHGNRRIR